MKNDPGLGFWLWLLGFLRALGDWFGDIGPDQIGPIEHLPDGHPDATPAPKWGRPKYPVSTKPGTFNRSTGRWNK